MFWKHFDCHMIFFLLEVGDNVEQITKVGNRKTSQDRGGLLPSTCNKPMAMLHFDVLYLGIFHRWVDFRRQVSVERRYDFGMIAHYTEWRLRLCSESLFPEDCIPGRKVKTLQLFWSICHDFKLMFCIGWLGNVLASRGGWRNFW